MVIYLLLLILVILIPLLMLPLGLRFINASVNNEKKNFLYNSKRSLKDDNLWIHANMFIGKIWTYGGIFLFLLNLVLYLSFSKALIESEILNYMFTVISLLISLALIFVSFIIVEINLIIKDKKSAN